MIILENINKSYTVKGNKFVVFRDLNLKIKDGESIALLGRNGAGKSTLLRIIGGIETPDSGRIIKNCSISWPIGMSGNFQGSLTGRENVKFACKIFHGNNKTIINSKIKYVEEFAEIGQHFDKPVKGYSNGMRMRVAFGLSMAFDFDVFLLDEIAAVGDQRFRKKSNNVLQDKLRKSSFIMVDHNLFGLKLCNKAFIIEKGSIIEYEDINEAINFYTKTILNNS